MTKYPTSHVIYFRVQPQLQKHELVQINKLNKISFQSNADVARTDDYYHIHVCFWPSPDDHDLDKRTWPGHSKDVLAYQNKSLS